MQPTKTEPEPDLSVSCEGVGQQWPALGPGALCAADLGTAQALLEEVAINPTIEPPELTQDWGNRLLKDKTFVHQDPKERSSEAK